MNFVLEGFNFSHTLNTAWGELVNDVPEWTGDASCQFDVGLNSTLGQQLNTFFLYRNGNAGMEFCVINGNWPLAGSHLPNTNGAADTYDPTNWVSSNIPQMNLARAQMLRGSVLDQFSDNTDANTRVGAQVHFSTGGGDANNITGRSMFLKDHIRYQFKRMIGIQSNTVISAENLSIADMSTNEDDICVEFHNSINDNIANSLRTHIGVKWSANKGPANALLGIDNATSTTAALYRQLSRTPASRSRIQIGGENHPGTANVLLTANDIIRDDAGVIIPAGGTGNINSVSTARDSLNAQDWIKFRFIAGDSIQLKLTLNARTGATKPNVSFADIEKREYKIFIKFVDSAVDMWDATSSGYSVSYQ
jgi:hypothetical protein